MPTVLKKTVEFDNRVQAGETTRDQIFDALHAAGFRPNVARPAKDPVSKVLNGCDFHCHDATAAQIDDIVLANPGVIGYISPVPPGLLIVDLENATSTVVLTADQTINFIAQDPSNKPTNLPLSGLQFFGSISGDGVVNTFGDLNPNPDPSVYPLTIVHLYNGSGTSYTINDGNIVLTFDGKAPIAVSLKFPLSMPARVVNSSEKSIWIDSSGNAYLGSEQDTLLGVVVSRNYADSVAAGAI